MSKIRGSISIDAELRSSENIFSSVISLEAWDTQTDNNDAFYIWDQDPGPGFPTEIYHEMESFTPVVDSVSKLGGKWSK